MPQTLSPILLRTAITDQGGLITEFFRLRWEQLRTLVSAVASVAQLDVAARSSALGSTLVYTATAAGWYRFSLYTEITRAATTSSSVQVTVTWTHNAKAMTHTFTAFTDNDTSRADLQEGMLRVDAATNISVSAAYASVGGTSMQYALSASVEREV